ncbi:MAG: rRNA maturation RNase YbeY [Paracoccaceae bacterium]
MEPLVDTLIEDARWGGFGLEGLAENAARHTLRAVGLAEEGFEISLLGCSDARIAELNEDFRGKPQPTNVLSWPARDLSAGADGAAPRRPQPGPAGLPQELGDIAIAWETCAREALDHGKELRAHVTHLLIHGTLHLLGYDHQRAADAHLMEGIEVRILRGLDLADPYE